MRQRTTDRIAGDRTHQAFVSNHLQILVLSPRPKFTESSGSYAVKTKSGWNWTYQSYGIYTTFLGSPSSVALRCSQTDTTNVWALIEQCLTRMNPMRTSSYCLTKIVSGILGDACMSQLWRCLDTKTWQWHIWHLQITHKPYHPSKQTFNTSINNHHDWNPSISYGNINRWCWYAFLPSSIYPEHRSRISHLAMRRLPIPYRLGASSTLTSHP